MPDESASTRGRWLFWLVGVVLLLAIFAVACYPYPEPHALWPQAAVLGLIVIFAGSLAIALRRFWIPYSPSTESTALWEEIRARRSLDDDEFYQVYYQGSGIPKELPTRLRAILSQVGFPVGRLLPSDNLALLEEDIDFAEVLWEVGESFSVEIGPDEYPKFDGTLDNLVRELHARTKRTVPLDEFL